MKAITKKVDPNATVEEVQHDTHAWSYIHYVS